MSCFDMLSSSTFNCTSDMGQSIALLGHWSECWYHEVGAYRLELTVFTVSSSASGFTQRARVGCAGQKLSGLHAAAKKLLILASAVHTT